MPRKKKAVPSGPGHGGRWQEATGRTLAAEPLNSFYTGLSPGRQDTVGFTLADEARQTSKHGISFWAENTCLRNRPVSFLSAGVIEPLKDNIHVENRTKSELHEPTTAAALDSDARPEVRTAANATSLISHTEDAFNPLRENSEANSSSSDEVILFKGRHMAAKQRQPTTMDLSQMDKELRQVEETSPVIPEPITHRRNKMKQHKAANLIRSKDEEEEALIADYINNMRDNGELDDELVQDPLGDRDLGGMEHAVFLSTDVDESENEELASFTEVFQETSKVTGDNTAQGKLSKAVPGFQFDESSADPSDSDSPGRDDGADSNHHHGTLDEFDFMNWERPSLQRKKRKSSRMELLPDCFDSDLEERLQASWKADRLKKSQRKKEREELRSLGLLGKKSDSEDPRVKYPAGMSIQEVAEEMRIFLVQRNEVLHLPPMDKHARKTVHDLANKFNVKSKSTGKASQRKPSLYRTRRTLPYVETAFEEAVSRISRRFLPRLDVKGKRGKKLPMRSAVAAAGYQDGEIVGAAAPELGEENRGRAMLQKMGWSDGTALGADHNKGILLPVTHAMKKTKAGLA